MRRDTITYDVFCQTVQKMQLAGEKISVRTILSHIGGAFGTIATFLNRWKKEQSYAQSVIDRDLSASLRKAILAEIGQAVAETKEQSQSQIDQTNEQLEETLETLARQEATLDAYEAQTKQLEQQLSTATSIQAQQLDRIALLEKKLEDYLQNQHETDKRAAVAEARCQELEKQLSRLEKAANRPKLKARALA
ncbi:MAG TPA: DNA-binding protein [Gammaproteobacteria bacterium]|nr:DNA-binding protein [Gammaproteobacteria bacterium]